jgi:hypothetical protein
MSLIPPLIRHSRHRNKASVSSMYMEYALRCRISGRKSFSPTGKERSIPHYHFHLSYSLHTWQLTALSFCDTGAGTFGAMSLGQESVRLCVGHVLAMQMFRVTWLTGTTDLATSGHVKMDDIQTHNVGRSRRHSPVSEVTIDQPWGTASGFVSRKVQTFSVFNHVQTRLGTTTPEDRFCVSVVPKRNHM